MSREWQPGDVAMVRVSSDYPPEVAVSSDRKWFVAGPRLGSQHGWYHDRVEVIRPLVVIDPEDAEQVERLYDAYYDLKPGEQRVPTLVDKFQAALREFADPKPRIEEPTGLGAVVEDIGGRLWTRYRETTAVRHWHPADGVGDERRWDQIDVEVVLSEGWSE